MAVICEEFYWPRGRLDSYVEYNCQMIRFSRSFLRYVNEYDPIYFLLIDIA